jgi:phage shock protein PspC (stress-responsive transcriptional regulator)
VGRPPLRRSTTDRYAAGVCGGLGRYYDVDPVIFRIAFPVLAIFAGAGVLLYALGWLLIPEEGTNETEAQRLFGGRGSGSTVLAVIAGVLGVIVFLGWITDGPGAPAVLLLAAVALLVIAANRRQGRLADASGPRSPQGPAPGWSGAGGWAGSATSSFSPPPGYGPSAAGTRPEGPYPPPYPPYAPPFGPPPPYVAPTQVLPTPPPRPPRERSPLSLLTVSVAALVAGVLVLIGLDPEIDLRAGTVIASVLVVVGLGLLVGTWFGRARSLIAVGIATVLALTAVATYDVPLRGGVGHRDWRPTSVLTVHSPYRLGAGDARLDLTDFELPGRPVDIEASIGTGELVVIVPDYVDLDVEADVGLGQVDLPNGTADGVGASREYRNEGPTAGLNSDRLIRLDLRVGVGRVEVRSA